LGKASSEDKARYQESIKDYKEKIEAIKTELKPLDKDMKVKKDAFSNYRRIIAANQYLLIIALYCNMSDVSMELLNIRNENYLNEARKFIYKVLILIEEVVTPHIDISLTELEDNIQSIIKINPKRKLVLIRKIGYNISLIKDGFGENSKWKWSFVEIEGRYATILKNLIDYKASMSNNDPRKPFYSERVTLMRMVTEQLGQASKRYREKYELSTREPGDMKKAIDFLNALRRIHILSGNSEEAQNLKRTVELYMKQMEENMKKKDAEMKKQKARSRRKK